MARGNRWTIACLAACALTTLVAAGCSRGYYRRQADKEVYGLIGCTARDPRWALTDYTINPNPASRFFDPNCPDCPPMPPDDPTSHELMECVDGKKGWPFWDHCGRTSFVENPRWLQYLPRDDQGQLMLDRRMAMQVALINSREYQRELEDLYLSALDVSFQRFRFDAQFFGGNSTFFTADGPDRNGANNSSSVLDTTNDLQLRKLNAFGGQFVADVANQFVWQFAGPDDYSAHTLVDFSLIQPLLRGAGRAVVLEELTESERNLLANVRQMERFRHGFYTEIMTGRGPGNGPVRNGLLLDALLPSSVGTTGGFYGLASSQIRIRNQRENVAGLRDSLDQIEGYYDAGRIDRLQVDQGRQALYNAQSRLLSLETAYDDQLDGYKITLGLPPQLDVRIEDTFLRQFDLVDPALQALRERVSTLLEKLRVNGNAPESQFVDSVLALQADCATMKSLLADDLQQLEKALPARRDDLTRLSHREEVQSGEVDPSVCDLELFNQRVQSLQSDAVKVQSAFEQLSAVFENLAANATIPAPTADGEPAPLNAAEGGADAGAAAAGGPTVKQKLVPMTEEISRLLLAMTLVEAATRLETVTLVQVDMDPNQAIDIARRNRLDWMNARAALVNSWRQIQVAANALRSDLDVVLSGDIDTVDDRPFRFRGTTGRLRVGFQFDAPLTRLVERNLYREALIQYQQARRAYYTYEDRVAQTLRGELRALRQGQLDFELRRAGVRVAVSQVDISRERLTAPPRPGQGGASGGGGSSSSSGGGGGGSGSSGNFGATTVRDLVNAYSGLLNAQDSFLNGWVDYEADRMSLDFDLGTMQLDQCSMWIDPGPVHSPGSQTGPAAPLPEEVPPPVGLPLDVLLDGPPAVEKAEEGPQPPLWPQD